MTTDNGMKICINAGTEIGIIRMDRDGCSIRTDGVPVVIPPHLDAALRDEQVSYRELEAACVAAAARLLARKVAQRAKKK